MARLIIRQEEVEALQQAARLADERNGVRWYCQGDRQNMIHSILLPEWEGEHNVIIEGSWVSGRFVFNQLVELTGNTRKAFIRGLLA